MKKYITIAALLAAGAAVANAALTLPVDSNNSLSNGVVAYWDFSSDQTSWDDYYTSTGVTGTFSGAASFQNVANGGLDSADGWTGDTPYNGPAWSASAATISFRVKNWSEGVLLQLTDNANSRIYSVGGELQFGDYDSGYTVSGDAWTTVTFVTNSSGTYAQTTQCYINGAVYTPSGVTNWDTTGFWYGINDKSFKQIGTQWAGGTKFKGVLDDLTVWDRALTAAEIVSFASGLTPIPEPSAFGLLAGLGALALVGTRRRRK